MIESKLGESRVSYVPFQRKVIEYETREYVERVPVIRQIVDYEERHRVETVPREVTKTDYMAVENRT